MVRRAAMLANPPPDLPPDERDQAIERVLEAWAHDYALEEKIADRLSALWGFPWDEGRLQDLKARFLRNQRAALGLNTNKETQDDTNKETQDAPLP
jgi:hypothetical protein